jgi:hypothetical protein
MALATSSPSTSRCPTTSTTSTASSPSSGGRQLPRLGLLPRPRRRQLQDSEIDHADVAPLLELVEAVIGEVGRASPRDRYRSSSQPSWDLPQLSRQNGPVQGKGLLNLAEGPLRSAQVFWAL